ncbi:MAG: HAD family hydrolase [Anaerolineales bacterium]
MAGPVKGVLFDLGGTLIYFDGDWPDVVKAANQELLSYLQALGLQLDPQRFINEFRVSLEEYYVQRESEFIEYTTARVLRTLLAEMGYPDLDPAILAPALKKLYAVSQAHWKREEDALPTLQTLRAAGYRMGVISNASDDADVQTLVENAGIRGYFDFVLSSAACGIRKPNPYIFEIGLRHWGFDPHQVAMVGDTLGADILGARNAGLYSIWITRRADNPGNRDHAGTIQPDAQVHTLAEVPGLLAGRMTPV